jgi:hypothetical protein
MNMYTFLYNINYDAFIVVHYYIYILYGYYYFTRYDELYIPSN